MPLHSLDIIDPNRNVVARLHWSPPNIVTVESENPALKAFLENMVQRYSATGIPSVTGVILDINGHKAYGGRAITLALETPEFLKGIAEVLNEREPFPDQEVYGLIRRWKDTQPSDEGNIPSQ